MNITEHIQSRNSFIEKMRQVENRFQDLNKTVLDVFKPVPNPCLIIHSISFALKRTKEISIIIKRLYDNRTESFKIGLLWQAAIQKSVAGMLSPEQQEIHNQQHEFNEQIALDFQTLLLFTNIVLDEWALIAGHVFNMPNPHECTFVELVKNEDAPSLKMLWDKHKASILWLDAFPRLYRNKMIVHKKRPWQLSFTWGGADLYWKFATPIVPGWLQQKEFDKALEELNKLAHKANITPEQNIYELVFQLLENIPSFDKNDRKDIYKFAEEFGFSTPSFQEFAHRLADFLYESTGTLIEEIKNNPNNVNLGRKPFEEQAA